MPICLSALLIVVVVVIVFGSIFFGAKPPLFCLSRFFEVYPCRSSSDSLVKSRAFSFLERYLCLCAFNLWYMWFWAHVAVDHYVMFWFWDDLTELNSWVIGFCELKFCFWCVFNLDYQLHSCLRICNTCLARIVLDLETWDRMRHLYHISNQINWFLSLDEYRLAGFRSNNVKWVVCDLSDIEITKARR